MHQDDFPTPGWKEPIQREGQCEEQEEEQEEGGRPSFQERLKPVEHYL